MDWNVLFIVHNTLLGIGLSMDAFSVSLANGLKDSQMKKGKMCLIAGIFAFFQAFMPMLGWICVHTILHHFRALQKWIPWIAFVLLIFIGWKMIQEGMRGRTEVIDQQAVAISALIIQGIATSIDALSAGFTISEYNLPMAVVCAANIAVITFFLCLAGVSIGKKIGMKYSDKATILGGVILMTLGVETLITGLL